MARTRKQRIENIETEMERLTNQRKQLLQQEKTAARKERNSRLCRRMGYFESLLPDTILLDDDHFKTFLNKTVANEYGKRTLAALKTSQETQLTADAANPPSEGKTLSDFISEVQSESTQTMAKSDGKTGNVATAK